MRKALRADWNPREPVMVVEMRIWLACLVVGCGANVPPEAPVEVAAQLVGTPARAAYAVVPAELGDPGAIDRIRHRARLRFVGRASPIHGEAPQPVLARAHLGGDVDRVLGVIGESPQEIRVVIEDDDARLALWIDRRDTWPTVLVPIQLGDREGRVHGSRGAFLATGAPIDTAFGRDRMRHVTLRDPDLVVDGWVPASVVGNVWVASPGDEVDLGATFSTTAFAVPADPRPRTMFAGRTIVRLAPDERAPIVATVIEKDLVAFVIARGEWTEIEIPRAFARVRGFVRASELRASTDDLVGHGSGTGSGFGMSHSDRIVTPAGTCLFDSANGSVVGVTIAESERHGDRGDDAWSRVFVNSPWAVLSFFVHDTGSDPKQPVWESCTRR